MTARIDATQQHATVLVQAAEYSTPAPQLPFNLAPWCLRKKRPSRHNARCTPTYTYTYMRALAQTQVHGAMRADVPLQANRIHVAANASRHDKASPPVAPPRGRYGDDGSDGRDSDSRGSREPVKGGPVVPADRRNFGRGEPSQRPATASNGTNQVALARTHANRPNGLSENLCSDTFRKPML
jgi:hypothetical protein